MLTLTPPNEILPLPEPDAVRAAIDATDERARLLRRLLRLTLRLKPTTTTNTTPPTPATSAAR